MIADEDVERVREAADIVAIIGEYVPLKGRGGNYRGPCPFHQGVNRNFSVSTQRGKFYHCFVCKESGDVFSFLQKRLGIDWPAAVRLVAEKCGIELREASARREGPDPREPLWEANAAAQQFFERMLWEDPVGGAAREYLASRALVREAVQGAALGFAPRDPGAMRAALAAIGIGDRVMLEAGLLVAREESTELRPRFRGRLMFPIHDPSGRIAGFGGRLLGPGEPKYLNSAESPIYSKGKLLYHLYQARHAIRRAERVLVVEGYFDALRVAAAGLDYVVAPLGTALTGDQAQRLVKLAKQVFLLYDGDAAGLKATFRAGDELLAQGASVRVVTFPDGEDPDTYVRRHGGAGLERLLKDALDIFERRVQVLERAGWFADLGKRRAAVDRLLPTIRATRDPVMRDLYLARASEASRVARDVLQQELEAVPDGPDDRPPRPTAGAAVPGARTVGPSSAGPRVVPAREASGTLAAERWLVMAMLRAPAEVERILERTGAEAFGDAALREIVEALRDLGSGAHVQDLAAGLSPAAAVVLEALLEDGRSIVDLARTVDDSLARLEEHRLEQRNRAIDRAMPGASDEEKTALLAEKAANSRELRQLKALRTNP